MPNIEKGAEKQTNLFVHESLRYVSAHLDGPPRSDPYAEVIPVAAVSSHLDVGCGNGQFLKRWSRYYGASKSVGIEPSTDAVNLLRRKHRGSGLIFERASIDNLPFSTSEFDLVTVWSVLHWVGRDEYLQALGEIVRVTSRYLVVMDFVAAKDYRVPYAHKPGLFTYKADFAPPILASGIMKQVEEKLFWNDPVSDGFTAKPISDLEIAEFEGNKLAYHSRKMVVFEKNYDELPSLTEEYFDLR